MLARAAKRSGADVKAENFRETLAADLSKKDAAVLAVTQRPISLAAASAPTTATAWKTIPSWYLLGTEDRTITPAAQRLMAERAGATIVKVKASHLSLISRPRKVAELIEKPLQRPARVSCCDRAGARYAAGGPNQVVSASGSPGSVVSPTQATYPSGRTNTAVGAVTSPSAGSSHSAAYPASTH